MVLVVPAYYGAIPLPRDLLLLTYLLSSKNGDSHAIFLAVPSFFIFKKWWAGSCPPSVDAKIRGSTSLHGHGMAWSHWQIQGMAVFQKMPIFSLLAVEN